MSVIKSSTDWLYLLARALIFSKLLWRIFMLVYRGYSRLNVFLGDVVCIDNIYINKRDHLIMRTKIKWWNKKEGLRASEPRPSTCAAHVFSIPR
jgi:hypothetical protein